MADILSSVTNFIDFALARCITTVGPTMSTGTSIDFRELEAICLLYPAIDNHAHPLLKDTHRYSFSFDGVISEASGSAAADSINTLACSRATIELGQLFQITKSEGEDVTWDDVKAVRDAMSYEDLCRLCFRQTKIQCMLLDDGLTGVAEMAEGLQWHDQFTRSPTKRIVRVEHVAEVRSLTFTRPPLNIPMRSLNYRLRLVHPWHSLSLHRPHYQSAPIHAHFRHPARCSAYPRLQPPGSRWLQIRCLLPFRSRRLSHRQRSGAGPGNREDVQRVFKELARQEP